MSILHISPTYKPAYIYGGVTVSISLLCETLAAAGHDVTVLSANGNGKDDLPVHTRAPKMVDGVKVYYFPRLIKGMKQFSPTMLWWLWQNVGTFETVHLHSWWNFDALCSMAICRLRGIKPIFSPRGMLSAYSTQGFSRRFFNKIIGNWLLKNSHLHATAPKELDECLSLKPNWQYTVLPNLLNLQLSMDKGRFSMDNGQWTMDNSNLALDFAVLPENTEGSQLSIVHYPLSIKNCPLSIVNCPFKFVFFSRIHPKKGLENLFEALSNVPFDWTLTIAGDGDEDYINTLKSRAEKLHISLHINWIGWVNPENKYTILQDANLMVLPSYNENFANVVIEALAVGTPVLISHTTGLADYVLAHNVGWVCDTTVEDIHDTLIEIYQNKEKREDISHRAPARIAQDFTPSVLAQKYVAMYEDF
jgi:glycosyltransferase involved in cell wall biosynthesis